MAVNEDSEGTKLSDCSIRRSAWRSADFKRACRRGADGCMLWHLLDPTSASKPARFVCEEQRERKCRRHSRG